MLKKTKVLLGLNSLKFIFCLFVCLFFCVGRTSQGANSSTDDITVEDILRSSIAAYKTIPPYTMNVAAKLSVLQKDTSHGGLKESSKELYDAEVRRDGEKVDTTIKVTRVLGKKKQEFGYRTIWNGQQYLSKQMIKKRYYLAVSENKKYVNKVTRLNFVGDFLEGYVLGAEINILEIIHNSKEKKLRSEMEVVDGYKCYVVDADSNLGKFTIWIDPDNGFSFRKMMLHQKSGDKHYDNKILPYSIPKADLSLNEVITEIKGIKIERIGKNYFPTEGVLINTEIYSNGKKNQFKWTAKRKNIQFDPDFETIGAFVMEGIPDGTKVSSLDSPQSQYVMHDGRAIVDSKTEQPSPKMQKK